MRRPDGLAGHSRGVLHAGWVLQRHTFSDPLCQYNHNPLPLDQQPRQLNGNHQSRGECQLGQRQLCQSERQRQLSEPSSNAKQGHRQLGQRQLRQSERQRQLSQRGCNAKLGLSQRHHQRRAHCQPRKSERQRLHLADSLCVLLISTLTFPFTQRLPLYYILI